MEVYYKDKSFVLIQDIHGESFKKQISKMNLFGFVVPTENIATIENSALVVEGVSRVRNALINGDYQSYDWDTGRFEIFAIN
jgi:hypothetical protein